ncbi:MAG: alpha-L-fucosidase [Phycisphaerales bacterium]
MHTSRFLGAALLAFLVLVIFAVGLARGASATDPPRTPLFNGTDLSGWKGLVADPPTRAKMAPAQLAEGQLAADARMRRHWSVSADESGTPCLVFDGAGDNLCSARDFADFELSVDWKIEPGGDSGIYLRGSPQVNIWDNPEGSGGLYNNQRNTNKPLLRADNPPGQWNTFLIRMVGERLSVWLNGQLVVHDTILENYWEHDKPIYDRGPIELQAHGNRVWFRNITVRELNSPDSTPVAAPSPATSSSATRDDDRLAWWRDARFGMFIHWGLYAIPAGLWEGKPVPHIGEWIMHWGKIPVEKYEKLAGGFNPAFFDAKAWAALARRAGMKYLVITTKHHDGFCLFDSAHTTYDIMDAAPFKRDIMRELADACRAEGIRIGWYHSIMDWHHPEANGDRFPRYAETLNKQVTELLTNYGPIDIMWFDGEWIDEWSEAQGREMYNLCRRLQPGIIVNNRVGKGRDGMAGLSKTADAAGDFGTPEQEVPATGLGDTAWESCMTMNDTWGFKSQDTNWKSASELVRTLVDAASKGGNLLLNVGPDSMGFIPAASVERLEAIGTWLDANGQSIYGTRASPFKRLPWGRCTMRAATPTPAASAETPQSNANGETLYLHVFDWPDDRVLRVPGLKSRAREARLLAGGTPLPFAVLGDDLAISVPAAAPDPMDTVIVLTLAEPLIVVPSPILAAVDGSIDLPARLAEIRGTRLRHETDGETGRLSRWSRADDYAAWEIRIDSARTYRVMVDLACDPAAAGARLTLRLGDAETAAPIPATGSWDRYESINLGTLDAPAAPVALATLSITTDPSDSKPTERVRVRRVRLVPN